MAIDGPRAYSYIRFSTPEQAKGASLARQLEQSARYAAANGLVLDESLTFKDLGVSAYDSSNLAPGGKLGEFLSIVKAGRVARGSYLLIESLDRLSRATIHVALRLLLELLAEGIVIVTLTDGFKYEQTNTSADFTSLIISLTILQRANDESRTKSMRVGDAWQRKRKTAATTKLTRRCPAWLRLSDDRKTFIEIPERVAIVREIISLTRQGLGRTVITKRLNGRGAPAIGQPKLRSQNASSDRPDGFWHDSYIHKIITNRALIGEFQPHRLKDGKRVPDGPPIADYYPRIIEDDEFALVQGVIEARGSKSGGRRGTTFSNIFTGLLKCGYCGSTMVHVNKGLDQRGNRDNRRNRYVVCTKAKRGAGCHHIPWVYYEFEDAFFEYASKTDFRDFVTATSDRQQHLRSLRDQLTIEEHRRATLKVQQSRLVDVLAKTETPPESVLERLVLLDAEAKVAASTIASLTSQLEAHEQRGMQSEAAIAALGQVRTGMQDVEGDEAFLFRARVNEHLRRVIEQITMFPGGSLVTQDERSKARSMLLEVGNPEAAVDASLDQQFRVVPDVKHRYFSIRNRGQILQVLQPEAEVPDLEASLSPQRIPKTKGQIDELLGRASAIRHAKSALKHEP